MTNIDFFVRISDYLWGLTDSNGALRCPWHNTEHSGKNIYGAGIDLLIYERTGDIKYFERASKKILRTCAMVEPDRETGAWIVMPGRFGSRNLSNNVIDCGACVDVFCDFLLHHRHLLSIGDAQIVEDSIRKIAETYLRTAAVNKEIPNQRLWGATGLAKAFRLFGDESWKEACIASIERSLREQHSDGSFPYHPNWREYNGAPGIEDISPYYQSRHIAFIHGIIESVDSALYSRYADRIRAGTEFLVGTMHPGGVKEMQLEQKRYYWNSLYEVASNSFDVYALTFSARLFNEPRFESYAYAAFRALREHQAKSGIVVGSRLPALDFKCPIFITTQTIWALRAVQFLPSTVPAGTQTECAVFDDAGVVKFKNSRYCAIFRFRKKPHNLTWGTTSAGGALLRAMKSAADSPSVVGPDGGRFSVRPVGRNLRTNWRQWRAANRPTDIRFRLWIASIELRAGKFRAAVRQSIVAIMKSLCDGLRNEYSDTTALSMQAQIVGERLSFSGQLADQYGSPFTSSKLERSYILKEDCIRVSERLLISVPVKAVKYIVPLHAQRISVSSASEYTHRNGKIRVENPTTTSVMIEYLLPL